MKNRIINVLILIAINSNLIFSQQNYAPNGGVFTPKGNLRVFVLFIGFGPYIDKLNYIYGGNDPLPDIVGGKQTYYSDTFDFEKPISPDDKINVSRGYYEMSNHKFRFMADCYKVDLDSSDWIGISNGTKLGTNAMTKFVAENPNFDWSKYDSRTNKYSYNIDNSNSLSDTVVDYVILVYRAFPGMKGVSAFISDNNITAQAILGCNSQINGTNYKFADGYTQYVGAKSGAMEDLFGTFIHEVGHELFDAPHLGGANGVVGNYFYGQAAGGGTVNNSIRSQGNVPVRTINAGERWYLGGSEIQVDSQNSKLTYPLAQNDKGFVLRDFVRTSDAVCIEIPSDTVGGKQRLWLENHQCDSLYFDTRFGDSIGSYPVIPRKNPGLYAYIENITTGLEERL